MKKEKSSVSRDSDVKYFVLSLFWGLEHEVVVYSSIFGTLCIISVLGEFDYVFWNKILSVLV